MFVKTGIDEENVRRKCLEISDKLGLYLAETGGDVDLVLEMLNGTTDERFVIIPPGEYITEEMFRKK